MQRSSCKKPPRNMCSKLWPLRHDMMGLSCPLAPTACASSPTHPPHLCEEGQRVNGLWLLPTPHRCVIRHVSQELGRHLQPHTHHSSTQQPRLQAARQQTAAPNPCLPHAQCVTSYHVACWCGQQSVGCAHPLVCVLQLGADAPRQLAWLVKSGGVARLPNHA